MPYPRRVRAPAVLLLALAASPAAAEPRVLNGFALDGAAVPADQIRAPGPKRDGIPALDDPEHLPAEGSPWEPGDPVLGVELGGEARAYPLAVLEWHEVVNDTLGGVPIAVTHSALCGTALVFDRRLDGRPRRFGVSGLWHQSDLLMFDRESESLWSQITGIAISGPARGRRLRLLRSRIESWEAWRKRHPDTRVLSTRTGHKRTYGVSPYGDYALSDRLFFDQSPDPRYHPKMPTLGLRAADGSARAYPAAELLRAGGSASESFGGGRVRVAYDEEQQVFQVEVPDAVDAIEGYWFAWIAFHPGSSVFVAEPGAPR
jgi:hypothetical protein